MLLYGAVVWYRQRSLIEDTPLSTVRSMSMGRVELEGEVVVADGDDLPAFTVSCGSEDIATGATTKSVLGFLSVGLVFALFGFPGLVTSSGPVVGVVLAAVTFGVAHALSGVVSRMGFATSA